MLALSSPRAQTGLTARDLLVGCVAENDPRSLGQALRLVQSIRWFGGEMADAHVMVCAVGGLDPSFRQALEGYMVRINDRSRGRLVTLKIVSFAGFYLYRAAGQASANAGE
jgi:hypothetical protein